MRQKMLFIFNPNTGGGRLRSRLMQILCHFSAQGYEATVYPTAGPGDARRIAREEGEKYSLVVCCGGDGTLNEVASGLVQCKKPPELGYIPGGTTNDFASSLGVPRANMLLAAERAVSPKKVIECDIGSANNQFFTYVAAFGAFTDVAYSTPQAFKNMFGYFAYIAEAAQKLPGLRPYKMHIKTPRQEFTDEYIFGMVSNSTSVGGMSFMKKNKVHMDDGVFEVLLIRNPQNLSDLGQLSGALLKKDTSSPWLVSLQTGTLEIAAEEPVPWTLDGEFGGKMQTTSIQVLQKALKIRA